MATVIWTLSSGAGNADVLDRVVGIVREKEALLIGLFVIDPRVADVVCGRAAQAGFLGGKTSQTLHASILKDYKDRAHKRLRQFAEALQAYEGVRYEAVLRSGEFAETCRAVVREREAELLLLGDLTKYSFYQFLSGPATLQRLEREAGCPVRVLKPDGA